MALVHQKFLWEWARILSLHHKWCIDTLIPSAIIRDSVSCNFGAASALAEQQQSGEG
jgi:hypothetical protein